MCNSRGKQCSQTRANKPAKSVRLISKGKIMWEKPVHCLQKVIYCSPVSLPILARLRGEELLPTPCKHLLIWRWTKARREILGVLQFYPEPGAHPLTGIGPDLHLCVLWQQTPFLPGRIGDRSEPSAMKRSCDTRLGLEHP